MEAEDRRQRNLAVVSAGALNYDVPAEIDWDEMLVNALSLEPGFVTGDLASMRHFAIVPMIERRRNGQPFGIEADISRGLWKPVRVRQGDGDVQDLDLTVHFNGGKSDFRVNVYWTEIEGTLVFGLRQAEIFNTVMTGDQYGLERIRQLAFYGEAVVEALKALNRVSDGGIPSVVHLKGSELVFTMRAIEMMWGFQVGVCLRIQKLLFLMWIRNSCCVERNISKLLRILLVSICCLTGQGRTVSTRWTLISDLLGLR